MVDSKESCKFDLGVKGLKKPLDKNIKTSLICIAYQCIQIKKSIKFLLRERVLIVDGHELKDLQLLWSAHLVSVEYNRNTTLLTW